MSPKDPNLPIIGGIVAAVGAGLCCAGPFILLLLGVSGSWIGNLTLLEPYRRQVIFWLTALAALVLVTSNYWIVWFA